MIILISFWTYFECYLEKDASDDEGVFYYQTQATWMNSNTLWTWFDNFERVKLKDFDSQFISYEHSSQTYQPLRGPFQDCTNITRFALLQGFKYGKNMLPHGKGNILQGEIMEPNRLVFKSPCYELRSHIEKIHGHLVKGKLDGKGTIYYNDQTRMKLRFKYGMVHGPALMLNKHDTIQGIGLYENGLLHGPFWCRYESTFVQIHFFNGQLIKENIIIANSDTKKVIIGVLRNLSHVDNITQIDVKIGRYRGLHIVSVFENRKVGHVQNTTKLPFKIFAKPSEQRLMIRPSQILYFNRVAKTGSLNLIILMKSLGTNLGYVVDEGIKEGEVVQDDDSGIQEEIKDLLQNHDSVVKSRHYAFFNLRYWGYEWAPDWFSVVRDPIERVTSHK